PGKVAANAARSVERYLIEHVHIELLLIEPSWLCARAEHVILRTAAVPRRHRTEEVQPIPYDGAADRTTELVVVILLLRVLEEVDTDIVDRVEYEPLNRRRRKCVPAQVVM